MCDILQSDSCLYIAPIVIKILQFNRHIPALKAD